MGLLERLKSEGLVKARGRQRTDSTHVLAAVRTLNRLERVGETLRAALNELAAVASVVHGSALELWKALEQIELVSITVSQA